MKYLIEKNRFFLSQMSPIKFNGRTTFDSYLFNTKQNAEDIAEKLDARVFEIYEDDTEENEDHLCGEQCQHDSDCALHNGPAYLIGKCNCSIKVD